MSVTATLDPLATLVAGTHYLFIAPLGTTLPTDCPAPGGNPGDGLDVAFAHIGYTADTGAAFAVDTQTTDLYASQSLDPIRTIVQSKKATIQAPLIEWSGASLITAFGGGTLTDTSNGTKYTPPPAGELDEVTAVLDIVDGTEFVRLVVERGLVAGSVSATLVKNAFATLPIVLTALAPVTAATAWHLIGSNTAFATPS